ncbi:MAG: RNA-binding transcriptional accessory protein [SAR324 cluster bacterium]|uniref:RNA-binding transcriptional accessory protein n=1 Tax=SAR324 cluster bacterium TaxID=2024889 RepID=A0A2D6YN93_9DELT|nr:RNA-binding transcriptional accessory protein [SAR324 cluster bacterium]
MDGKSSTPNLKLLHRLQTEFDHQPHQIRNTLNLLLADNTIPFVARYRKEQTGNLDEVQIANLLDRYEYLKELEDRRETILNRIREQEKLTEELEKKINEVKTKQELEDLYIPYKPKRRTRAMIAREKGLEPLAQLVLVEQGDRNQINAWLDEFQAGLSLPMPTDEIWRGVRDICAEKVAEDAQTRARIRQLTFQQGKFVSEVKPEFQDTTSKFEMYYEFSENISKIQPHRYLAIRRGEKEEILQARIQIHEGLTESILREIWVAKANVDFQQELHVALSDSYDRLLAPSIETEIRQELKQQADKSSIGLFSKNLRQLLMQPPGGARVVIGLDPGFRTGTKWVVIDHTGRLHENGVIYPVEPQRQVEASRRTLLGLIERYQAEIVAVGNGTGSREVSQFLRGFIKDLQLKVRHLVVNESGASVYSASEIARQEFPNLDLTVRGAVSIARRYQDPLAELVKIDPKSIGVGQYQHDVNQKELKQSLDRTVESCVNQVGVELNQASAALLSYVSGVTKSLAARIVSHRDENGPFRSRQELMQVTGFGKKAFEQAAGFLRIRNAEHPLDQSAVHPERYSIVEQMAASQDLLVADLIGNQDALQKIQFKEFVSEEIGSYTLSDIFDELKKPGRDPRDEHQEVRFNEAVQDMKDLQVGMHLQGVVTNITHFGAFVDIGVHQDGLVHISQMSAQFTHDPLEACAVGQHVEVWVLEVDTQRKRIALSMRNPDSKNLDWNQSKSLRQKKKSAQPKSKQKQSAGVDQLMEKFRSL